MDSTEHAQPNLNSSYVPNVLGNHHIFEDEESEDSSPSASLLPKHSSVPLAVRYSPKDSYCLVYIIFFLMGIGSLLPWNFFITAKQYWLYKLGNNTHRSSIEEQRSDLMDYFESYLAIASTVPSVLCLILNYVLVNRLSQKVRIILSLLVILLVFVVTTVLVKVDTSDHNVEFFAGTLASVAIVSGASNIFSGSVFGISGRFPMRISQALISGQAMGGTLTAVASIVDLAVAKDVTDSALAYFLTADVFIVLCIITYLLLPKLEYAQTREVLLDQTVPGTTRDYTPLRFHPNYFPFDPYFFQFAFTPLVGTICSCIIMICGMMGKPVACLRSWAAEINRTSGCLFSTQKTDTDGRHYMLTATSTSSGMMSEGGGTVGGGTVSRASVPPLQPILRKTWVLGLSVFYVFSVSIMVFPAVSSGIQSVNKDSGSLWTTTYFVPFTSFLLYNVADFCGRQATAWLQFPGPTSRALPVLVLCRSIMVPLFMFCNYQPRDHLHTVLFTHDVYPVVFNCLLGLSNGYLGSLPMIYGPKVVPRELAEATGVVMTFFLTLGLSIGSAFSVLIVHCI